LLEPESQHNEKIWKIFIRKHWGIFVGYIVAALIAIIGAVLVFLWFVGEAQTTNLVPLTLGLWTMGHLVTFLFNVLFWELLLIGVPILVFIIAIYLLWWKKLPAEERAEYHQRHLFGKKSRGRDGGGAITFLINIGFIIKVYIDGNWNVPFATWTFEYLIYSYLLVLLWMALLFGIPLFIGGTVWLYRELKKTH
jgi:hypothetical protein